MKKSTLGQKKYFNKINMLIVFIIVLGGCIFYEYGPFFKSKMNNVIFGGDHVLLSVVLEHWNSVFHFNKSIANIGFFYPIKNTLGYSETYFLEALFFYFPFKIIGVDQLSALTLSFILMSIVSFVVTFYISYRKIKLCFVFSLLVATVFCFSNMHFSRIFYPHLLTPFLFLFLYNFLKACQKKRKIAYLYCVVFFIFISLYAFSNFYAAFGAILFLCILSVFLIFFYIRKNGCRINSFEIRIVSTSVATILISSIPFLLIYAPITIKNEEAYQSRSHEYLTYRPYFSDIINTGEKNLVWGWLAQKLQSNTEKRPAYELTYGYPLLFLFLLVIACCYILFSDKFIIFSKNVDICIVLSLFVFTSFIFVSFFNFPLWGIINKFVPGGGAIRCPARLQIVISFIPILIVFAFLDWVLKNNTHIICLGIVLIVVASVITEQIKLDKTIDFYVPKNMYTQLIKDLPPSPATCEAYFITSTEKFNADPYHINLNSIFLMKYVGIPTINGYSGIFPKNWNLFQQYNKETPNEVICKSSMNWWKYNKMKGDLCQYQIYKKKWSVHHLKYIIKNIVLDFSSQTSTSLMSYFTSSSHWYPPEPWGQWSDGFGALEMYLDEKIDKNILAFFMITIPPQRDKNSLLNITCNDITIFSGDIFTSHNYLLKLKIDQMLSANKKLTFKFNLHNCTSPNSLGLSKDNRVLGVGLRKAVLTTFDGPHPRDMLNFLDSRDKDKISVISNYAY